MVGFFYHAADSYFQKICGKHKLAVADSTDDLQLLPSSELELVDAIDPATGEILTEAEIRKFDDDIYELKDLPNTVSVTDAADTLIIRQLAELLGDILIVR